MSMGMIVNNRLQAPPGPRAQNVLHGELLERAAPPEKNTRSTSPTPATLRTQPGTARQTSQLAVQAYRANLQPASAGHGLIDLLA